MKKSKIILPITYLMAVLSVALIFFLVSGNLGVPAKSLTGTKDPQLTVAAFFNALHEGDLSKADEILGHCELVNTDMPLESEVNRNLYDALCSSISFRFAGDCRIDGLNAVQKVEVTYFDIGSSVELLNTLAKEQIDLMLSEVDNASELYDESGDYRQDVVMEVFEQAVTLMLGSAEDYCTTKEFDVDLYYEDDNWYIQPSESILDCMVGGLE